MPRKIRADENISGLIVAVPSYVMSYGKELEAYIEHTQRSNVTVNKK